MQTIRTFLAIPLLPDVCGRLKDVQAELRRTEADVRWEPVEKVHLTLRFIGDVTEELIGRLAPEVERVTRDMHASEMVIAGLGAFPNTNAPRIVWAGVEQVAWLSALALSMEQCCRSVGLPAEERPFHPHLTLGRVKGMRNSSRLTEALKTVTFEPIPQRCTELLLIKSVLKPEGSVYTPYQRFPFQ